MRDPEFNIQARIEDIRKDIDKKDEAEQRKLREELRLLNMRKETVRRMKAYGVKFRKNQD